MPQPDPANRRRAFRAKVKTGCMRCRTSHVRCTEEKPACARCLRIKVPCRYPDSRLWDTTNRKLLPTAKAAYDVPLLLPAQPAHATLSARKSLYFDRFRNQVIYQLGSQPFDEFWNRTVLRDSAQDDCIMDAVLAIGALAHALDRSPRATPLYRVSLARESPDGHHREALRHYTRSLATLRRRLSSGSFITHSRAAHPRLVLSTTLLFSAFELLQGNSASVDQLMSNGLSLLRDALCTSTIAGRYDDAGIEEAEMLLVRRSVFGSLSSPQYPRWRNSVRTIPLASSAQDDSHSIIPDQKQHYQVFWTSWMRFFTSTSLWYTQSEYAKSSREVHQEHPFQQRQANVLEAARKWDEAVSRKLAAEPNPQGRRTLRQMLPAIKNLYYSIRCMLDPASGHEDLHALAADIVALCESIFDDDTPPSQRSEGEIYEGVQAIVVRICRGCRDRAVRDRAMALYARMVDVSSRWDAKGIYMGTAALVALEDAARDGRTGAIAASDTLWWTGSSWNEDFTEFDVTFRGRVPGRRGDRREVTLTLRPGDFGLV